MREAGRARLLAAGLASAALLATAGCGRAVEGSSGAPRPRLTVTAVAPFRQPVRVEVVPGDTIESVSRRVAGRDWVVWRDALASRLDPRKLLPGLVFEGYADGSGRLETLRVRLDRRIELTFRSSGGAIRSKRIERPVESRIVRVAGGITSSLFGAVASAGERPELAVRLADIFQWDIDFFRDLRKGDRFLLLVERQTVDGSFYRYGPIFAARFVNGGRELDAILYRGPDGRPGYYDLEGRPLRKQFLKAPLRFSRITSRFSLNRYHPVLHRRMPHYGVDYGAPVGTPVHATADGVVTWVGRKGGAGKMVTVRHPNAYETSYLHLSRYAPGIRRGVRVRQGQVIGFVGQTGYATGPHLDYRIRHDGRWINPLRLASPPAKPLEPEQRNRFLQHVLAVTMVLEGQEPPRGACC